MTSLGGGRPIQQQQVYSQDTEPAVDRDGVLWSDTSVDPPELKQYDDGAWVTLVPQATAEASETGGYTGWLINERQGGTATVLAPADGVRCQLAMESGFSGSKTWTVYFTDGTTEQFSLSANSETVTQAFTFEPQGVEKVEQSGGSLNGTDSRGRIEVHKMILAPHYHEL